MPFSPKIGNIGKSGNSYNVSNFYESIIHPSFFIGGGIKKKLKNNAIAEVLLRGTFDYEYPISEGQIKSTRYELTFNYLFASAKK
jgi:hypothetical protein